MISVHIPNSHIPERTYIIRILLTHYCGVPVEIIPDDHATSYTLAWEDKSIELADDFFGRIPEGSVYADPKYLPEHMVQTTAVGLEGILMIYGTELLEVSRNTIACQVDLFAGAFFMLSRWEESLGLDRDLHDRFPAAKALTVRHGFILRPIVDEYVSLLRRWLSGLGYPLPVDRYAYKVIPSCDVDIPFYWRSKPLWKILGGRLKAHRNPFKLWGDYKKYKSALAGHGKDPYDQFDYLMKLAEGKGMRFQFNFIGGGKTKFEGIYKMDDPHMTSLIQEMISRGHTIGVHPSYDAYNDPAMMKMEKQTVESSANMAISASRQHYLRFAVPDTWQHLHAVGIKEDSTMGYAAEPGFRCGTCKPFPVFDIHQREELALMERPLLIMDVSLRMYKNLDIQDSIILCEKIKEQVRKHNGELVVLWHNSCLSEIDGWSGWNEVLEVIFE